jgi:hypothetical protein
MADDAHKVSRRTTLKAAVGGAGGAALGAGGFGATEAAAADSSDVSSVSREPLVLWNAAPATDWEREALPIGNGALGAMVFGTTVDPDFVATRLALAASRTRELTVRSTLLEGGEVTFKAVAGRRCVWTTQG